MSPNVFVVVVDALRADRVGSFGGREVTPNIDSLAEDATVFPNAFTTANTTDPAITSLQTGRYPLSHGIVNHGSHVTDEEKRAVESVPMLAEVLSEAGYYTAALGRPLGRWHRAGFDEYPELSSSHWKLKEMEKKASAALHNISPRIGTLASQAYTKLTGGRSDDETDSGPIASAFEEIIAREEPYYAFVHLMDTHTPYDVDSELVRSCLERFDYDNVPLGDVAEQFPDGSVTANSLRPGGVINRFTDEWKDTEYGVGTAVASAHYDAAAMQADRTIGILLDKLRSAGQLDDTLVVVLADHGESLTEHGIYYEHHGLYDQTTNIPLIVRPPGGTGSTCDDFVKITDVAPTVLSYLGVDGLADSDGQSLKPVIEGDGTTDRTFVVAEEANTQRRRMIRTNDEKLIYLVDGDTNCRYCEVEHAPEKELYDLEADPSEERNTVDENAARVKELRKLADEWTSSVESVRSEDDSADVQYDDEDEVMQRLEDLGYR